MLTVSLPLNPPPLFFRANFSDISTSSSLEVSDAESFCSDQHVYMVCVLYPVNQENLPTLLYLTHGWLTHFEMCSRALKCFLLKFQWCQILFSSAVLQTWSACLSPDNFLNLHIVLMPQVVLYPTVRSQSICNTTYTATTFAVDPIPTNPLEAISPTSSHNCDESFTGLGNISNSFQTGSGKCSVQKIPHLTWLNRKTIDCCHYCHSWLNALEAGLRSLIQVRLKEWPRYWNKPWSNQCILLNAL